MNRKGFWVGWFVRRTFRKSTKLEPNNMVSLELLFLWTSILLKTDSGPILQNQRFHKKNTQSRSLHFNRNTNSLLTVSEISCTTFHKIRMTNLCTYYRLLAPVPSFMQAWQIRPLKCPINPQPKYVYISLIIFHSLFSAHLYCHSSTILFRYELKCIPHFIPMPYDQKQFVGFTE